MLSFNGLGQQGRLGNQMFQYAFARAASIRNGAPFKLDLTWFDLRRRHRDYGLNRFNIIEEVATREEIAHLLHADRGRLARRLLLIADKFRPPRRRCFVQEDLSRFDRTLLAVGPNAYVFGYFGSERYFADAAEIIRREFTLRREADQKNAELIRRIARSNAVCLSVRRGDFVASPLYDVCGPDYFQRAAAAIAERVAEPHFFMFSDDNEWLRRNLKLNYAHTFVTYNHPDFYEDLRLMNFCKHYVIPNSSFSWWGAWLTRNPGGVTIAPDRWLDLGALKSAWGTSPPSNPNADLNGDGTVGLLDLGILKKNWGKSGDA